MMSLKAIDLQPEAAIANIFRRDSNHVVGMGILVNPDYLVTCTHVVNDALGLKINNNFLVRGMEVYLSFPLSPDPRLYLSTLEKWTELTDTNQGVTEDIAVLRLKEQLQIPIQPARFIQAEPGERIRAFGFPTDSGNRGFWASGFIRGELANKWMQIEEDQQSKIFIEPGFSGTGVWDHSGHIVGIVVAVESSDKRGGVGYLIPPLLIKEIWPDILLRSRIKSSGSSLPPDLIDFSCRDELVQQIIEHFVRPPEINSQTHVARAVALSGMAGVGKSAVAIHVAHQLSGSFPDGQIYVDLRGSDSLPKGLNSTLEVLLSALDEKPSTQPKSTDAKLELYRTKISSGSYLLLLDNVHNVNQVKPLIPANPNCGIILTSRVILSSLPSALFLNIDSLEESQAVAMLERFIGKEHVFNFEESARRIALLCGGLPLAIRIASSRVLQRRYQNIEAYEKELSFEHDRLARLKVGDLDIRASFALSYKDLDVSHATFFRQLGVLNESEFTLVKSASIWKLPARSALEVLEHFADVQFVETEIVSVAKKEPWPGNRRYRIHDLIRLFAEEKLREQEPTKVHRSLRKRADKGQEIQNFFSFAIIKSWEAQPKSWETALESYKKTLKKQKQMGISDFWIERALYFRMAAIYARFAVRHAEEGSLSRAIRFFNKGDRLLAYKAVRGQDIAGDILPLGNETGSILKGWQLIRKGITFVKRGDIQAALKIWNHALPIVDPEFETHAAFAGVQGFLRDYEVMENHRRELGRLWLEALNNQRFEEAMELLKQEEELIRYLLKEQNRLGLVLLGGEDDKPVRLRINLAFQANFLLAYGRFNEALEKCNRFLDLKVEQTGVESATLPEIQPHATGLICEALTKLSAEYRKHGEQQAALNLLSQALMLCEEEGLSEKAGTIRLEIEKMR